MSEDAPEQRIRIVLRPRDPKELPELIAEVRKALQDAKRLTFDYRPADHEVPKGPANEHLEADAASHMQEALDKQQAAADPTDRPAVKTANSRLRKALATMKRNGWQVVTAVLRLLGVLIPG